MFFIGRGDLRSPAGVHRTPLHCGDSNLSTDLLLWGIYIKKCISPVRIRLQTGKPRNASTKFRKTSESKKAEKSLEISAFLVFSCLHLNQTRIMAGIAGLEPAKCKSQSLVPYRLGYIPIFFSQYFITHKKQCQYKNPAAAGFLCIIFSALIFRREPYNRFCQA